MTSSLLTSHIQQNNSSLLRIIDVKPVLLPRRARDAGRVRGVAPRGAGGRRGHAGRQLRRGRARRRPRATLAPLAAPPAPPARARTTPSHYARGRVAITFRSL